MVIISNIIIDLIYKYHENNLFYNQLSNSIILYFGISYASSRNAFETSENSNLNRPNR